MDSIDGSKYSIGASPNRIRPGKAGGGEISALVNAEDADALDVVGGATEAGAEAVALEAGAIGECAESGDAPVQAPMPKRAENNAKTRLFP